MNLFYRTLGEGKPLIILHGLFGASDNWLTHGKRFAENRKVFLLDQRNHGASPHSSEFTYEGMVDDLLKFIQQHDIIRPDVLGHSMGGKVAMRLATHYPDQIDRLVVVDIGPKSYPVHHDVILEGLKTIPIDTLQSRQVADGILAKFVDNASTRQFLLKNLKRTDAGFAWKINLDIIHDQIENVGEGLADDEAFSHPALFIRGSLSDYILDSDIPDLNSHFPNNKLVTIKGAGHWVHAEKPLELAEAVENFLGNE